MKIQTLILLLTLAFAKNAKGQNNDAPPVFEPNNAIGIAVGIHPVRTDVGISYSPAFIINYEHVAVNTLGPGVLSAGIELGIYSASYGYYGGTTSSYKSAIAARVLYHLTILNDKVANLDPYGGLAGGIYSSVEGASTFDNSKRHNSAIFLAPFIGVKYNITPGFGLWAEGGFDVTFLKIGIHFNF